MYASDDSITLSPIQIEALNTLYRLGYERGVYSEPIMVGDYLIPSEYRGLRES
jgi:1,4-dihydroxy-6-naphthoate synthase